MDGKGSEARMSAESGYVQPINGRLGEDNEKRKVRRGEIGERKNIYVGVCG